MDWQAIRNQFAGAVALALGVVVVIAFVVGVAVGGSFIAEAVR